MTRTPLQQFQHDQSRYERPNSEWQCGRAGCGRPCNIGPDHKGRCHTTAECLPTRNGDRWVCTRSGTSGGNCGSGPLPDGSCCNPIVPCSPVRSLRSVRGTVVRWAAALTAGVTLLLLGLPANEKVFTPGPLSTAHGHLVTEAIADGASQCSACHGESESAVAQILGANNVSGVGPVSSDKCLVCHDNLGAYAKGPHALSPDALARLTDQQDAASDNPPLAVRIARSMPGGVHDQAVIDCVSCHTEHHGRTNDITAITDAQCQSCHSASFPSFTEGHPEFNGYPYDTPQRIKFDHVSHIRTHFPASRATLESGVDIPTSCTTCHMPDQQAASILVRGYEQSCASCHSDQIAGVGKSGLQGVAFFRLPAIDTRSLEERGVWIGAWPADSAIYDDGLTPYMRLLLSGDERVQAALERTSERDLLDLYEAEEAALEDAQTIAWAVKELVYDVIAGGQSAVRERLEAAMGRPLTSDESRRMLAGLPVDTMLAVRERWFPALHVEVAMHRAGLQPEPESEPETESQSEGADGAQSDPGGEASDDLFADDVLGAEGDEELDLFADDVLGGDEEEIDLFADDVLSEEEPAAEEEIDLFADDVLEGDDNSSDNDLFADDVLGSEDDEELDLFADDVLSEDDGLLSDDLLSDDLFADDVLGSDSDDAPAPAFEAPELVVNDVQAWVEHGGWFISEETASVVYRPTGHADTFLQTWIDLVSPRASIGPAPALSFTGQAAQDVYAQLSDPAAPGVCMKCHAEEPLPMGGVRVHWLGVGGEPDVTPATRFPHRPHLTDMGENACIVCHTVSDLTPGSAPSGMRSTCFQPMQVSMCQECHKPGEVGDSCTTCHNYHVGVPNVRAWGGSLERVLRDSETQADAMPAWQRAIR